MKIRKKTATMTAASAVMCIAVMMAVFPSYAEEADVINSKGSIVLDNGEAALYGSDMDVLQDNLEELYSELSESPDELIAGKRREQIKSRGMIDYDGGTVILDSKDLIYLADGMDTLETSYKREILQALNEIDTYYNEYYEIIHEENMTADPVSLTLKQLKDGILNSQTVETGTTFDNLSKGKGAWVNGKYIVGNGNDVNAAYSQGYIDGVNYTVENADITYTYHEHVGEQADAGTGCYTGSHSHTSSCIHNEICSQPIVNEVTHLVEDTGLCYGYCAKGHWTSFSHGGGCSYRTTSYGCDSLPYNTWSLTCGKTEGVTIESATILFP